MSYMKGKKVAAGAKKVGEKERPMANSTTGRSKQPMNNPTLPKKLNGQVGDLQTARKAIKKTAKGDRGKFIENRFGNVPL